MANDYSKIKEKYKGAKNIDDVRMMAKLFKAHDKADLGKTNESAWDAAEKLDDSPLYKAREHNTQRKHKDIQSNYVSEQEYKKGEQGRKGRVPNMGRFSDSTFAAAHDMASGAMQEARQGYADLHDKISRKTRKD